LYELRPPIVVKSILHRSLLKWWNARRGATDCPEPKYLLDEELQTLLTDCIIYQVSHLASEPGFFAKFQGPGAVKVFGRDVVGTNLVDHVNPKLLAGVIEPYRIVVQMRRPVFTIRHAKDANGVPVSIETLRLPLANVEGPIDKILVHYCFISSENRFAGFAFQDTGELPDNTVKAIIEFS
jgi:hypothetical protein